jgi:hypothetical protein
MVVTANIVPTSPTLVTLIMVALRYPETSVRQRAARRNIPEDGIPHTSGLCGNGLDGLSLVNDGPE